MTPYELGVALAKRAAYPEGTGVQPSFSETAYGVTPKVEETRASMGANFGMGGMGGLKVGPNSTTTTKSKVGGKPSWFSPHSPLKDLQVTK